MASRYCPSAKYFSLLGDSKGAWSIPGFSLSGTCTWVRFIAFVSKIMSYFASVLRCLRPLLLVRHGQRRRCVENENSERNGARRLYFGWERFSRVILKTDIRALVGSVSSKKLFVQISFSILAGSSYRWMYTRHSWKSVFHSWLGVMYVLSLQEFRRRQVLKEESKHVWYYFKKRRPVYWPAELHSPALMYYKGLYIVPSILCKKIPSLR